ncbi:zinc ribbon domain-containing protein [Pelotomaculum isophthalicicum JI]|uniref:Zinc ribbon domain-containing protein n=1 Tax=Pelotomaculum isophthalicicum JI TaxID=947010 RepID=A0A9X4H165_9FIRM|nr:zinc ribbon domain-containing protein [Pelotomaculum isophthalicicum]MDF9407881.1 zinc ribbon domain-containing protein [Pelotomaculum isophthalicicum JI]
MFCSQCGNKVNPGDHFCGQCGTQLAAPGQPAPAVDGHIRANDKESLLNAIEQALAAYPQLAVERTGKSDLEIKSVLADANWGVGKKKVEYSASLLAKETGRTVVFWEMLKETGAGMGIFGGFKIEKYKSDGRTRSGTVREAGFGPGGEIIDYNWDYAQTRSIVEDVVKANGWKFTTSLLKSKARY